jgi:hypothetical protein
MVLFTRGLWRVDGAVLSGPAKQGKRRKGEDRPRTYGGTISGVPLVVVERLSRCRATVRLVGLAALVGKAYVEVPAASLRLPQAGWHNPEGNRPSRVAMVRATIGAAIAGRWRQKTGQPVKVEEVLGRFAGIDLARVTRRRREATWFDALTTTLVTARAAGGPGLDRCPPMRRPVLTTLWSLTLPAGGQGAPRRARAPA